MPDWPLVVMVGGPSNGYTLYGPFGDADDAIAYVERNNIQDSWWLVPLAPVD
jgi:hypothetical protein